MTQKEGFYWTKIDWLLLVMILLALGVSLVLISQFPERVPVHWNIAGEADRYGSKYINLFLLPLLSLAALLMMSWLPKFEPFGRNYRRFATAFQVYKVILTGFFLYLYVIILYSSYFRTGFSASVFFVPALSVLFVILGYYLPRLKRNFFIGIRTPWTLYSDESWDKSHLLAGRVFVAAGIVNLLGLIFRPELAFGLFMVVLVVGVLGITVYSYLVYKADKKRREL
jgi:uncharacterized membrane protein